jgi:hypothetical protein
MTSRPIEITPATFTIYFISLALQPPLALASAFQVLDHFTDGRTPWTSDQLVARPLPKHRIITYTHQTSMPSVGFEPTIPASERAKTVLALDRSATVTGCNFHWLMHISKGIGFEDFTAVTTKRTILRVVTPCS